MQNFVYLAPLSRKMQKTSKIAFSPILTFNFESKIGKIQFFAFYGSTMRDTQNFA